MADGANLLKSKDPWCTRVPTGCALCIKRSGAWSVERILQPMPLRHITREDILPTEHVRRKSHIPPLTLEDRLRSTGSASDWGGHYSNLSSGANAVSSTKIAQKEREREPLLPASLLFP
eukprot:570262-Amphidinium_carterae.1